MRGCAREVRKGQTRRLAVPLTTSGLPRQTDILRVRRHASNVPITDISQDPVKTRLALEPNSLARRGVLEKPQAPSAFAVLRLIASSNFVGCCTDNLAGFKGHDSSKRNLII